MVFIRIYEIKCIGWNRIHIYLWASMSKMLVIAAALLVVHVGIVGKLIWLTLFSHNNLKVNAQNTNFSECF